MCVCVRVCVCARVHVCNSDLIHYTLHRQYCILLHPEFYTLHPTPYTLYPIPYTHMRVCTHMDIQTEGGQVAGSADIFSLGIIIVELFSTFGLICALICALMRALICALMRALIRVFICVLIRALIRALV